MRIKYYHKSLLILTNLLVVMALSSFGLEQESTLSLSRALDLALGENPSAGAARMRATAAEHRLKEARSRLFPQINATGGYSRYEDPVILIPARTPPVLDDQIYEMGLHVGIPLISGQAWSGIGKARSIAAEAAAADTLVRLGIISRVSEVFIAARELSDNRILVDSRLEALRQRHRELEILYTEGRVSPAEIALLESSIDSVRSSGLEIEQRERELAYNLGRLLGTGRAVVPEPLVLGDNFLSRTALPEGNTKDGPASVQSKSRLEQAEFERTAAVRGLWPELTGFAAYTFRSGGDLDFSGGWAAGLSLRLPLFDAARRTSAIQAADAAARAAELTYREARNSELVNAGIVGEKLKSLVLRRGLLAEAVRKKEVSFTAYTERYKEGRTSLSELLSQEAELFELKTRERSLLYQTLYAYLDYHTLRGTLTPGLILSMTEEN